MTPLAPGDRFRLWPAVWPLARILVLSVLPVLDLLSRLKVRRAIQHSNDSRATVPGRL